MSLLFAKADGREGYYVMESDLKKTFYCKATGWSSPQVHVIGDSEEEARANMDQLLETEAYRVVDDLLYIPEGA